MDENTLPVKVPGPWSVVPGPTGDQPSLRLILQPNGTAIEVTRPDTVIGRHSQADICLRLPDVSRRHCRLIHQNGEWHLFDLHSLNGTTVNGERVEESVLHHRDRLGIGGLLLEVDLMEGKRTLQLPSVAGLSTERQILGSITNALPRAG
jgi:pSer/pThr/pTyr-binding forkhead associated (FHA) protein